MEKKNIIFNHTLEQYNKKYKNRNYRLLKYTKKEVEDFSKKNNCDKEYLLRNRRWWFIKDTYYEIPKPVRFTWFRNLNAGIQTGVCVLGAGVVATAVVVPTVLLKQEKGEDVIIDPVKEAEAEISVESKTSEGTIYKVSPKDASKKKITAIESVYIGNDKLEEIIEYGVKHVDESVELTIKKEAFKNHKGIVKVNPIVEDKEPEFDGQVTSDEWDDAIKQLLVTNESRNVTAIENITVATLGSVEMSFKLDGSEEKAISNKQEKFTKKDGNIYYAYSGGTWEKKGSQYFEFDEFNLSTIDRYLKKCVGEYKNFKFENGQYERTLAGGDVLIIKFADHKHISDFNADIYSKGVKTFDADYKFSDYGTTKIEDFPEYIKSIDLSWDEECGYYVNTLVNGVDKKKYIFTITIEDGEESEWDTFVQYFYISYQNEGDQLVPLNPNSVEVYVNGAIYTNYTFNTENTKITFDPVIGNNAGDKISIKVEPTVKINYPATPKADNYKD